MSEAAGASPDEAAEEIMAGFRRTMGGVSARFTTAQAGIVRLLVGQVAELIGGEDAGPGQGEPEGPGSGGAVGVDPLSLDELDAIAGDSGSSQAPEDPVLARLFPDAYREDPEAAADFRRYTEHGLRSEKMAAARTVLATLPARGGRVRLSAGDGAVWLRALNDVRLALGVRLGITDDYNSERGEAGEADPRSAYFQVYDWLTFLQETLVRALW